MKNLILVSLFLVILSGISMTSFAQATSTASANSKATIVIPLSITNTLSLEFGNVAVSASTAGTVVLAPAGTRSVTGGVTLPSVTGTVRAAEFTVAGTPAYIYEITLPSSVLLDNNASGSMTVNGFQSTPSGTGTLDGTGNQTLKVGATLNVGAAQDPGIYESDADFEVTVDYN